MLLKVCGQLHPPADQPMKQNEQPEEKPMMPAENMPSYDNKKI